MHERCPECGAIVRSEPDPEIRPFVDLVESRRRRDASAIRRILEELRRQGWLIVATEPKPKGGR